MPRLDIKQKFSKRCYYFGILSFICFLIYKSFKGLNFLTGIPAPQSLDILIISLFAFVTILALFSAVKSWKEPQGFKKTVGLVATAFATVQLIMMVVRAL